MKPLRRCSSWDDVVLALGGIQAVALLTKRRPTTVYKWRERGGLFPAPLYAVMSDALHRRGTTAPRELWGFQGVRAEAA